MSDQIQHYRNKLKFEMDSWDLFEALNSGKDVVVIDARANEAYEIEHIPSAISFPHLNRIKTAQLI